MGGNFSGIRAMREAETALTRRNGRELQIASLHLSELNKIKTLIYGCIAGCKLGTRCLSQKENVFQNATNSRTNQLPTRILRCGKSSQESLLSVTWSRVTGVSVHDVRKERNAFIFKKILLEPLNPWRRRQCFHSKRRKPISRWRCIASQKENHGRENIKTRKKFFSHLLTKKNNKWNTCLWLEHDVCLLSKTCRPDIFKECGLR